ncbi:malate dehydrogenase [Bacteroidota bacterium]
MKISIIGAAGCVGSCAAFNIAIHGLADEIVIIGGRRQNVLKQHAMDLGTAVAARDILVRTGSYEDISGSDIVIISASIHEGVLSSRMELLPSNLPLILNIGTMIKRFCPEAVVITATNPVDPLNYGIYLLNSDRDPRKFIGYSVNDSYRFRMMVASALGVKTSELSGIVIGEHGSSQVLLFSSLRIGGKQVLVSEEFKQKIRQQVPSILNSYEELKSGRTSGWTSAVGLVNMCRAIGQDTGEVIPCSVALNGEYGHRGLSMTVPAILGRRGVQQIMELKLSSDEYQGLEASVETLRPAMRYVEENLLSDT